MPYLFKSLTSTTVENAETNLLTLGYQELESPTMISFYFKDFTSKEKFIDFMCRPDIAKMNAEYIGYASPNKAVIENKDYYYYGNEILYPKKEDMPKVQYYHNIDDEIRKYYETLWVQVKLH